MMNQAIVLFDGYCNFCNSSVNFLIKHDKKRQLKYAAIQSDLGAKLKSKLLIPNETDSIIFIDKGVIYFESDAVINICRHLPYPLKALFFFRHIPRNWRDWGYKFIARNRYKWFGKGDKCRIPTPDEKELFPEDFDL